MSDNSVDVILVTDDDDLRQLVSRLRPPRARLRSLTSTQLREGGAPRAGQWWLDLDAAIHRETPGCHRRVYFYSRLTENREGLETGLFVRKPCTVSVLSVLWAGVVAGASQADAVSHTVQAADAGDLPAWLLDLHELDLRNLCHRCIEVLPARLGYDEVALYLYDAEQDVLTLAETNSKRTVDFSVPLTPDNPDVLATVARSRQALMTDDLAEACRTGGMRCPADLAHLADVATLIVPLMTDDSLCGVVRLCRRSGAQPGEARVPPERVFAFLARCLRHARQHQRACVEARVDQLTGLYNHRWIVEALGKEIQRAERHGSSLAVLMLDLDGLKPVNDRFGHLVGDALLRHVARKISAQLRQIDSAARFGGDEFVVLLPATDAVGARQVARRILSAIRSDAPVIQRKALPVAASLGVAQWRAGWDERRLLQAADEAMYSAKRKGHNRLVCYPHVAAARPAASRRPSHSTSNV